MSNVVGLIVQYHPFLYYILLDFTGSIPLFLSDFPLFNGLLRRMCVSTVQLGGPPQCRETWIVAISAFKRSGKLRNNIFILQL